MKWQEIFLQRGNPGNFYIYFNNESPCTTHVRVSRGFDFINETGSHLAVIQNDDCNISNVKQTCKNYILISMYSCCSMLKSLNTPADPLSQLHSGPSLER